MDVSLCVKDCTPLWDFHSNIVHSHVKNKVFIGLSAALWKTEYTINVYNKKKKKKDLTLSPTYIFRKKKKGGVGGRSFSTANPLSRGSIWSSYAKFLQEPYV